MPLHRQSSGFYQGRLSFMGEQFKPKRAIECRASVVIDLFGDGRLVLPLTEADVPQPLVVRHEFKLGKELSEQQRLQGII